MLIVSIQVKNYIYLFDCEILIYSLLQIWDIIVSVMDGPDILNEAIEISFWNN